MRIYPNTGTVSPYISPRLLHKLIYVITFISVVIFSSWWLVLAFNSSIITHSYILFTSLFSPLFRSLASPLSSFATSTARFNPSLDVSAAWLIVTFGALPSVVVPIPSPFDFSPPSFPCKCFGRTKWYHNMKTSLILYLIFLYASIYLRSKKNLRWMRSI